MFSRWRSTVRGLIVSSSAIWPVVCASAISFTTCRSRGVSRVGGLVAAAHAGAPARQLGRRLQPGEPRHRDVEHGEVDVLAQRRVEWGSVPIERLKATRMVSGESGVR
jgi:hypothetical protein